MKPSKSDRSVSLFAALQALGQVERAIRESGEDLLILRISALRSEIQIRKHQLQVEVTNEKT